MQYRNVSLGTTMVRQPLGLLGCSRYDITIFSNALASPLSFSTSDVQQSQRGWDLNQGKEARSRLLWRRNCLRREFIITLVMMVVIHCMIFEISCWTQISTTFHSQCGLRTTTSLWFCKNQSGTSGEPSETWETGQNRIILSWYNNYNIESYYS